MQAPTHATTVIENLCHVQRHEGIGYLICHAASAPATGELAGGRELLQDRILNSSDTDSRSWSDDLSLSSPRSHHKMLSCDSSTLGVSHPFTQ